MAEESGALSKVIIEKLTHENYDSWSFRMMMLLVDRDLWEIVNGDEILPPNANNELKLKFKKRSQKALALIGLHVGDEFLPHIIDAKNPRDLWKTLKKFYTEQSQAQRIHLRRQLQQIRMRSDESISQFVKRVKSIVHRLSAAGYVPGEDEQICALLNGLPEEYKTLVTVLESETTDLKISSVTTRLLLQEAKIKDNQNLDGNNMDEESAFRAKEVTRCRYCKKKGHLIQECRKLQYVKKHGKFRRPNRRTEDVQIAFLTMNEEQNVRAHWILDSGASSHMTCNKSWLTNFRDSLADEYVTLGDGRKINIQGSGDVSIKLSNDGVGCNIRLKNVLYVPQLATNLISLPKTTSSGLKVHLDGNSCTILTQDGRICAKGIKKNNLYTLERTPDFIEETAESAFISEESTMKLWHYRLAHLNFQDLGRLSSGMVDGMNIQSKKVPTEVCVPCTLGKAHLLPVSKERTQNTKKPFELVHSDLCGPITPVSLGGAQYILTLTDDYSRVSWVRFLKKKSEVAEQVQNWITKVEKQYGKDVARFRSDRGGEYLNTVLKAYFAKKGIQHELTVAYTPSQNGVAERLNRTLLDKARCMLQQLANQNKSLWAEAVATANYLKNRSPTRSLQRCTPYERLTNQRPDIHNLRIFGSKAFVVKHKPDGKLDSRCMVGIMMGYSSNSKGYRIYDEKRKRIIVCSSVLFDEASILKRTKQKENEVSLTKESEEKINTPLQDELSRKKKADEEYEQENDARISERRYPERVRKQTQFYKPGEVSLEKNKDSRGTETAALVFHEPLSYQEAVRGPEKEHWLNAIEEEMRSLQENNTWELCKLPEGQKAIQSKWVFRLKRNEKGEVVRHKARLVAKGYTQRMGIDYDEIFAPVTRFSTLRILLSIAAVNDLEIQQVDIKTAFLNGQLEEEVYMEQPEGYKKDPNLVCRLKKALYGLKQAPRAWFFCLFNHLKKLNFAQASADPGLYMKQTKSGSIYILVYVDDLLLFGSNIKDIRDTISFLEKVFDTRNMGEVRYFLGIKILRNRGRKTIKITQEQYVKDLLTKFNMKESQPRKVCIQVGHGLSKAMCPQEEKERKEMESIPYQSLIGGLIFLANCTRPDIAYAVNLLSRFMQNPGLTHWKTAKEVLRYLKGTSTMGIVFGGKFGIEVFCDADFAGDIDTRRSTTGYMLKIAGGCVSWASRVQPTVALSTMEAEYMAAAEAVKEVIWCRKLLEELTVQEMDEITINCDNQSCMKLIANPVHHRRSKHIDIKFHFLREHVSTKTVKFIYCSTENMFADILTKAVSFKKHEKCSKGMGLEA